VHNKLYFTLKTIIQVILLILLMLYGISGLGITETRIVGLLSFGIINKPLSFQIHNNLMIPFIVFLLLHIFFKPLYRLFFRNKKPAYDQ